LPEAFLRLLSNLVVWHFIAKSRIGEKGPSSAQQSGELVRKAAGFASRLGITPKGDAIMKFHWNFPGRGRRCAAFLKEEKATIEAALQAG
jgi:hypothetical protein